MRILLITADQEASERIRRRVLAEPGNELEVATGFAQAIQRDLGRFEAALAWHAELQGLDGALLKDFSQVSRRMPVVAVLSRALWSARRPSLMLVDGWFFLEEEAALPSVVLRLAGAGYWAVPEFVARERAAASGEPDPIRRLNPVQQEVLQELRCGRSNREIAHRLSLPEQKVKKTVHEIIAVLGVSNRTQVAVFAHVAKLPEAQCSA